MKLSYFVNRENNNLDLIRIILACMVIIGHAPILNGESDLWRDPVRYLFSFTYSGALAVKLFFFISGFVVTNSILIKKSPLHFIVSRSFRLIPALLFVLIISVFVAGPFLTSLNVKQYFASLNYLQYIRHNLFFTTDYILPGVFNNNLFPITVNGALWSLKYEVGCYITLLGVFLLLSNKNKYYLNIPILLIIIDALLPTRFLFPFLGDNPEVYLLPASFAFGAFFAVNIDKISINFGIVVGSFLILYIFRDSIFAQLILVFACCNVLVYFASTTFALKLKPKYDISYGIYLWGFLAQQSLYHFIGHIYVGWHCIIALIISVVLALITNIIIEKPFINIGKSVYTYLSTRFAALK